MNVFNEEIFHPVRHLNDTVNKYSIYTYILKKNNRLKGFMQLQGILLMSCH